jgi:hypothetical protein
MPAPTRRRGSRSSTSARTSSTLRACSAARYDARPGSTYLFRPDQYLCARFRAYDAETLAAARAARPGETAMTRLLTDNRFANPDAAYTAIIDAHRGLGEAESGELNARLVLILANHIGDAEVLAEALALARGGLGSDGA